MSAPRMVERRVATCVIAGAVTAAAAIGLFAWDTEKTRGSDGNLHGPYEPWQVVCMVGVVLAAAVWVGVRHEPLLGAASVAVGAFVGVITSAVSTGGAAGGFIGIVIGAVLAAVVFAGVVAVGFTTASLASRDGKRPRLSA